MKARRMADSISSEEMQSHLDHSANRKEQPVSI